MDMPQLSPSFAQTGYGTFSYIALSSCLMNDSKVRKITTAALSILELQHYPPHKLNCQFIILSAYFPERKRI